MRKILIVLLCLASSSYVNARTLSAEEVSAVENAVRGQVKETGSLVFSHWEHPEAGNSSIYCGTVQGKNSYGGNTGKRMFSTFLVKNDSGEAKALPLGDDPLDGSDSSQQVTSALCAGAGYDIKISKALEKSVNKTRRENGLGPIDKSLVMD